MPAPAARLEKPCTPSGLVPPSRWMEQWQLGTQCGSHPGWWSSPGVPLREQRGDRVPLGSCSQPSWASPRDERSGACPSPRSGPCAAPLPAPGFLGAQAVLSRLTSLHQPCCARAEEAARGSRSSWPVRGAAKVMLQSPSWGFSGSEHFGQPFSFLLAPGSSSPSRRMLLCQVFIAAFFLFFLMCQF